MNWKKMGCLTLIFNTGAAEGAEKKLIFLSAPSAAPVLKTLLFYLALATFPVTLTAEALPSSNSFFEKDFVTIAKTKSETSPTKAPQVKGTDTFKLKPLTKSHPIEGISLLLNASDPEHVENFFLQAKEIGEKYKIQIRDVMLIGDTTPLFADKTNDLFNGPGTIQYYPEMPRRFEKVTSSPTFILETNEGLILIEGIANLSSKINTQGEFVE